ncbi:MAG: glycosyltransferase N-terminal domain-containing protein [Mariprofundales bacterium]
MPSANGRIKVRYRMLDAVKWRHHLTLDLPPSRSGSIWIHACSVGEVGSVTPLIRQLCRRGAQMHLTVVTATGFAHAHRLLEQEIAEGDLTVAFLPWDLPGLMARMLNQLQPRALLLTETEFWPGMLAVCRRRKVTVVGLNTRISDRSFPRYLASRWLWRRWLAPVACFLAQSPQDAERLLALGVAPARVEMLGNLKTAVSPPDVDAEQLRQRLDTSQQRPILLIASSHAEEEEALLAHWQRWQQSAPDLLAVVVPRHPARFDDALEACRGLGLATCCWSEGRSARADESVMLVDAMGVLGGLFVVADVVIVGGSIGNSGGHNPLEAAVCGRGVVTGPYVQNFRALMDQLQHAGAAVVAEDADAVALVVKRFLDHPQELRQLHGQSVLWMQQQGDVLQQVVDRIHHLVPLSTE